MPDDSRHRPTTGPMQQKAPKENPLRRGVDEWATDIHTVELPYSSNIRHRDGNTYRLEADHLGKRVNKIALRIINDRNAREAERDATFNVEQAKEGLSASELGLLRKRLDYVLHQAHNVSGQPNQAALQETFGAELLHASPEQLKHLAELVAYELAHAKIIHTVNRGDQPKLLTGRRQARLKIDHDLNIVNNGSEGSKALHAAVKRAFVRWSNGERYNAETLGVDENPAEKVKMNLTRMASRMLDYTNVDDVELGKTNKEDQTVAAKEAIIKDNRHVTPSAISWKDFGKKVHIQMQRFMAQVAYAHGIDLEKLSADQAEEFAKEFRRIFYNHEHNDLGIQKKGGRQYFSVHPQALREYAQHLKSGRPSALAEGFDDVFGEESIFYQGLVADRKAAGTQRPISMPRELADEVWKTSQKHKEATRGTPVADRSMPEEERARRTHRRGHGHAARHREAEEREEAEIGMSAAGSREFIRLSDRPQQIPGAAAGYKAQIAANNSIKVTTPAAARQVQSFIIKNNGRAAIRIAYDPNTRSASLDIISRDALEDARDIIATCGEINIGNGLRRITDRDIEAAARELGRGRRAAITIEGTESTRRPELHRVTDEHDDWDLDSEESELNDEELDPPEPSRRRVHFNDDPTTRHHTVDAIRVGRENYTADKIEQMLGEINVLRNDLARVSSSIASLSGGARTPVDPSSLTQSGARHRLIEVNNQIIANMKEELARLRAEHAATVTPARTARRGFLGRRGATAIPVEEGEPVLDDATQALQDWHQALVKATQLNPALPAVSDLPFTDHPEQQRRELGNVPKATIQAARGLTADQLGRADRKPGFQLAKAAVLVGELIPAEVGLDNPINFTAEEQATLARRHPGGAFSTAAAAVPTPPGPAHPAPPHPAPPHSAPPPGPGPVLGRHTAAVVENPEAFAAGLDQAGRDAYKKGTADTQKTARKAWFDKVMEIATRQGVVNDTLSRLQGGIEKPLILVKSAVMSDPGIPPAVLQEMNRAHKALSIAAAAQGGLELKHVGLQDTDLTPDERKAIKSEETKREACRNYEPPARGV